MDGSGREVFAAALARLDGFLAIARRHRGLASMARADAVALLANFAAGGPPWAYPPFASHGPETFAYVTPFRERGSTGLGIISLMPAARGPGWGPLVTWWVGDLEPRWAVFDDPEIDALQEGLARGWDRPE